jgi:hypothetical protein
MATPKTTPTVPVRVPLNQIAGFIGVIVVALNVVFYVLSSSYYAHSALSMDGTLGLDAANVIRNTRIAFAVFTALVGGAGVLAAVSPRAVGHGLGALFGLAALLAGIAAIVRGMPGALSGAMLVLGALLPVLVVRSLAANRAAWSFLTVICGVLGLCLLFGAPKIRTLFGIGLWSAMIIPGLLAVATIALSMMRGDYQTATADEPATGTAPADDDALPAA